MRCAAMCMCDALTIKNGTKMTSPVEHATIEETTYPLGARASASPVAARRLALGLPLGPSLGVLRVHL